MKKYLTAIISCSIALVSNAGLAPAASADVPGLNNYSCDGRLYFEELGSYTNKGGADLPLRCGDSTFGFNHILERGHFTPDTNHDIQETLTWGLVNGNGDKVLYNANCKAIYFVSFGYNAKDQTDELANPIGIVTAYEISPIQNAKQLLTTADDDVIAPPYGSDCPIITPIGD